MSDATDDNDDDDGVDEPLPNSQRSRRTVTIPEPIDSYLEQHVGNVSGFIGRILWDGLGEQIPDKGPHYEYPNVQQRVFKLQLNAVRKEIHELKRMEESLEEALEQMDDEPDSWNHQLWRILNTYGNTSFRNDELIQGSDPDDYEYEDDDNE